jgi:hypothetical protein
MGLLIRSCGCLQISILFVFMMPLLSEVLSGRTN